MSYRKIAAFPVVWAAVFIGLIFVFPEESRPTLFLAQGECSKALATVGCFLAAYTFEKGAYLRRAWSLNAWCYLLLFSRDIVIHVIAPGAGAMGDRIVALTGILVFAANVSSCIGAALMARAWSIAGLELPGSKGARIAVMMVAALMAVGISGSDLLVNSKALFGGNLASLHSVASDLGDIFGLALIAPVLLTAIAMRGGVLTWPWALMTASLIFWLLYDAASIIEHSLPGHAMAARATRETFRALACATEFAAGVAQRRVLTEPATPDDV